MLHKQIELPDYKRNNLRQLSRIILASKTRTSQNPLKWNAGLFEHMQKVRPKKKKETFDQYLKRVFTNNAKFCLEYWWIFDSEWQKTDFTYKGIAQRIQYFLEHGVPQNLELQQMGCEPLCYK